MALASASPTFVLMLLCLDQWQCPPKPALTPSQISLTSLYQVSGLLALPLSYSVLETSPVPLSILSALQAGQSPLVGAEICLSVTSTHSSSGAC